VQVFVFHILFDVFVNSERKSGQIVLVLDYWWVNWGQTSKVTLIDRERFRPLKEERSWERLPQLLKNKCSTNNKSRTKWIWFIEAPSVTWEFVRDLNSGHLPALDLSAPAHPVSQHVCPIRWQRSNPRCWLKMKGKRDCHVLPSHPVQLCQVSKALMTLNK
jgi:hypothetical protein